MVLVSQPLEKLSALCEQQSARRSGAWLAGSVERSRLTQHYEKYTTEQPH